jgi:hypothetical protein
MKPKKKILTTTAECQTVIKVILDKEIKNRKNN